MKQNISKKMIQYRLSHSSGFEVATFGGRVYVQVGVAKTKQGAKTMVARVHALGFRARASPFAHHVMGEPVTVYMIYAGDPPDYETRHFVDSQYLQTGHGREWTRRRVKKS